MNHESKTNSVLFTRRTVQKWLPSEIITVWDSKIDSLKDLVDTLDKTPNLQDLNFNTNNK